MNRKHVAGDADGFTKAGADIKRNVEVVGREAADDDA